MGRVAAICLSAARGTPKEERDSARLVAGHGLAGDAHAGNWHRQISILPLERIEAFRRAGAVVALGAFGENLVVEGVDWSRVTVGDRLQLGEAVLVLSQFGKECHAPCRIHQAMGDCIMPRHGVFARVERGGTLRRGDRVVIIEGDGHV